jgi:Dullard-like phosphatase family protein
VKLNRNENKRLKKLLLLDLDETLVHSENFAENTPYDFIIDFMDEEGGSLDSIGVYFRPYLTEFLEKLSEHYTIGVFTASTQEYADAVVGQIDPEEKLVSLKLYRQHCTSVNDYYVKDLSMFTNVPRKDMLMLDNFIYSFALDLENGIPIKPYYKGKDDYELEYLCNLLMQIKNEPESTTLVDFINKSLGLDRFYEFLDFKNHPDNENDLGGSRATIVRKSVVVGGNKLEMSPEKRQNSLYVSPSKYQGAYQGFQASFRQTADPVTITESSDNDQPIYNYTRSLSAQKSPLAGSSSYYSLINGGNPRIIRESVGQVNSGN